MACLVVALLTPASALGVDGDIGGFIFNFIVIFAIIQSRHILLALILSGLASRSLLPQRSATASELCLSLSSSAVFALVMALFIRLDGHRYLQIYQNDGAVSWLFYVASFIGALVLQDAFFYFVHRVLHRPFLYRLAHKGHHRSSQPSVWTSFAFDPVESLIHAICLIAIVVIIPLHPATLFALLMTMSVWAAVNHISPETLPDDFPHHWLGPWVIGPLHHCIHHRKQTLHYGLYFTFWDRVFRTQAEDYALRLEAVQKRSASSNLPS